jgi:serine protease Do
MQDPAIPPPIPARQVRPPAPPSNGFPALVVLLLLTLLVWQLPRLVENVEYAYVRGRERAEVEGARGQLAGDATLSFTRVSEQVAKSIGPSVVHVDVEIVQNTNSSQDELTQLWFGGRQRHEIAQGSGVIMDAEGYILTNNHVVDGASAVTVNLSDGREEPAEVIGSDPLTDLAVLKINAEGLIPAPWGDSDKLPVGAPVWAVGNPYTLDRSVTFGIISAKNRRGIVNPNAGRGIPGAAYQEFLQTDAAVNPGNSGGPLVDASGQVVGINTAIVGQSYQGISFAIPSETAHEVYDKLRKNQRILRGYLGVKLEELTPQLAKKLALKDVRGALVTQVVVGSPAERAGLEPGDVIVQWHGQAIDSKTMLQYLIARTDVGTTVECVIVRDGQQQTKTVEVAEAPVPQRVRQR